MPKESNFFEEAYRLCGDQDSFVSHTAKALYEHMLDRHKRDGLSPRTDFNILYFLQSAIRLLLEHRPSIALGVTQYPYRSEPIRAVNVPELDDTDRNHELFSTYIRLVNADSMPNGSDFDVGYALLILSAALGPNGMIEPPRAEASDDNSDSDEWLAGFNSK